MKIIADILSDFAEKSRWREQREDAILEAFRRSSAEKSYTQCRDELFRELGLGKIED